MRGWRGGGWAARGRSPRLRRRLSAGPGTTICPISEEHAMTNLSGHRIMLDSVNWKAILAAVKAGQQFRGLPVSLAAGYLDGPVSQWPPEAWTAMEAAGVAGLVGITVTGKGAAAGRARA